MAWVSDSLWRFNEESGPRLARRRSLLAYPADMRSLAPGSGCGMLAFMDPTPARQGWPRLAGAYRRLPAGLRWLLAAPLLAWLAYVVVVNLVLNTPLGPRVVNIRPERVRMDWGPALSLWPGRVTVWKGEVHGQVGRMLWQARAGRLDCHIALRPLLHREMRMLSAHASDVTGGARPLPAGQAPLPLLPTRPDAWTLRFDDLSSDSVRALSLGPLVLEGNGRGQLAFSIKLRGGPLEVRPSSLRFTDARVRLGDTVWLRNMRLDGVLALPPHTRAQARGMAKLSLADIRVNAEATGLAMQGEVLPKQGLRMQVGHGSGQMKADLHVQRLALQPGSRVEAAIPLHVKGIEGPPLDETLRVALDVDDDIHLRAAIPERQQGQLQLDTDLRMQGREVLPLRVDALLARTSGKLAGRWHFGSMRWLPAMIGDPPWLKMHGGAEMAFDLRMDHGKPLDGSHFSLQGVQALATVMGIAAEGAADVKGQLSTADSGRIRTGLQLDLVDFALRRIADRKAFAQGKHLLVDVDAVGLPPAVGGKMEALDARLRFDRAQVPDMRVYNRLLTRALRIDAGQGNASADLALDPLGGIASGAVRLQSSGARMHILGLAAQGNLDIDAQVRRADLRGKAFVLDGTRIRLDAIQAQRARGEPLRGLWLDAQLQQARMDFRAARLDARASARMRDVSLLLEIFAERHEYPRWIDRFIVAGGAQGSARLAWQPGRLRIDQVTASNNRYTVQARMQSGGDAVDGQLLAHWGPLAVGVGLRNGRREFHLLRPAHWYEAQRLP